MKFAVLAIFIVALPAGAFAAPLAEGFDDPALRGSLFRFDRPIIPNHYRGNWADKPENCRATRNRGLRVRIFARHVGELAVIRIEGYSDYPAIVVQLGSAGARGQSLFLDLSDDEQRITYSSGYGKPTLILHRCPMRKAQDVPENSVDAGWMEQAQGACDAGDFGMFFEAFLRSTYVQRRFLAPRIRYIRIDNNGRLRTESLRASDYRGVPIAMSDYLMVIDDGTNSPEKLHTVETRMPDGSYRIDWSRARFDDRGEGDGPGELIETYGEQGRLIIEYASGCWRLSEDSITPADRN